MQDSYTHLILADEIRSKIPELTVGHVSAITSLYRQPWRTYHNTYHILRMLQLARMNCTTLTKVEMKLLTAMIFYHNAIYNLGREPGWNENLSAGLASSQLTEAGWSDNHVKIVRTGILATINHSVTGVYPGLYKTIPWLIDLDLFSGFGETNCEFVVTGKRICEEYSPLYTADEFWRRRKIWARDFLNKRRGKSIYANLCFESYEPSTRQLLRELAKTPLHKKYFA